jgi:hypothetical protein
MRPRIQAPRNLLAFGAALTLLVLAAGCGSLTRPSAQTPNVTDTVTVYMVNGTPVDAPTGVWFFGEQAVVFSSSFEFDVAFDIDSTGQTKLYTARYLAGGLSTTAHTVSLQRHTGSFDDLLKVPTSGYVADSLLTANAGDVFLIQTADPQACSFSLYSNVIYAKLEVLSIDPTTRSVKTRFTVDPNCGFLSLVPSGIPQV